MRVRESKALAVWIQTLSAYVPLAGALRFELLSEGQLAKGARFAVRIDAVVGGE